MPVTKNGQERISAMTKYKFVEKTYFQCNCVLHHNEGGQREGYNGISTESGEEYLQNGHPISERVKRMHCRTDFPT